MPMRANFPVVSSAVVALARALINDPILILADEPTSDLDEQAETEVLHLLHRSGRRREHADRGDPRRRFWLIRPTG